MENNSAMFVRSLSWCVRDWRFWVLAAIGMLGVLSLLGVASATTLGAWCLMTLGQLVFAVLCFVLCRVLYLSWVSCGHLGALVDLLSIED